MEIVFLILGTVLVLAGIVGSIAPGVPGPPLAYISLFVLELAQPERVFSDQFFIVLGIVTLVVTVVENLLPLLGARVYGASRRGMIGAILGLIAGIFILPPFGLILGVLLGAVAGEVLAGKSGNQAWRAGFATFLGNLASILLKLILSLVLAYYFFSAWF